MYKGEELGHLTQENIINIILRRDSFWHTGSHYTEKIFHVKKVDLDLSMS